MTIGTYSAAAITEACRVHGIDLELIGLDTDEPSAVEVEVMYQGSLDESFTILPEYSTFVADAVAKSVADEYERDADHYLGWSVKVCPIGAPFGTPPTHVISVMEMD